MATKILYVVTKANLGGAQRYVYDLATAARDAGYTAAVAYGTCGELAERLHEAGLATFPIAGLGRDINPLKDVLSFFSLLRIIRSFKPDIIHLNSSKISGIGALAGRLLGVHHIIFTAHAWAFNEERPQYQKAAIAFLSWLTIILSTRTIVVSDAMRRQTDHWPFTRAKVSAIPNGTRAYALLDKLPAREALAARHPVLAATDLSHDLWVGTVAELHPVKGLSYAIEAIRLLHEKYPTLRYVLLSDGEMRAALEAQIADGGLEQTVFLLGHVKEAPLYGRAYDIFLLPSTSEAFGIALLEAGLAALPAVASRVGGIPEILTDRETGLLVPPKNATAIARALETLLVDEPLRHRLGTALRERVVSDFSIERVVHETFALYAR